jgi:hypothetical protein
MNASGAEFSACRRWRTLLWRCWDEARPAANFLMLNPSTADEAVLDPTCARAQDYARRWGYGTLLVTNVFAWRATDPGEMRAAADSVGAGNDAAILGAAGKAQLVVCAWGNHGLHLGRSGVVQRLLRGAGIAPRVLRLNANGEPTHPLYLPRGLRPRPWR